MSEMNNISPQLSENSLNNKNILFSYKKFEKEAITQILHKFKPSNLYFFRNFPIGFVTLNTKNLEEIHIRYPAIFSRLHISEQIQVIPSFDELHLQSLTTLQQSEYIDPASIIRATELYDQGIYGSNVKIAIIDSGIDDTHSDFSGRIDFQKSFVNSTYGYSSSEDYGDFHGHGTHVAGIAAGGGSYYPGIAYNARLYNLKAVNMAGYSTEESVLAAIDEAIEQNVHIISISLGSGESLPWEFADYISLAVDLAVDNGIVVVVAAGNEGENNPLATISSPAAASKAITVGATNGSTEVVSFSSRGPSFSYRMDPDVVAPGYQIIAPLASDSVLDLAFNAIVGIRLSDYIVLSGTSMAAPVVSGAIALLKQKYPTATPAALRAALQESAVDLGSNETVYTQGSGLIDVTSASTLLEDTESTNGFDLISSVPRANTNKPIEFADRVEFPGDYARMTLSFLTGTGGKISWQISDRIKKFVSFDTDDQGLSGSGYFEKSLNVSIPLDTIPEVYQGDISYNFLGKKYSIPFSFEIKNPISKVYLDTHYTGKDDSIFFNYRTLDEFLVYNSSLDINEYETAITWENLSQNDILVLTDLEYPISNYEMVLISKFHEHNGSILLVTSAFPFFNPHPYSQIVEKLGVSVNFSDRVDLINYSDNGRSRDIVEVNPEKQNIRWDSDNPLLIGVDQLPTFIGTGFKVSQSDPNLKYTVEVFSSAYLMVAGFEPSDKGKL
ncbi:MAG: S8 family serine peptidase, partial [Candidatus Hodarchaeota archaeon]